MRKKQIPNLVRLNHKLSQFRKKQTVTLESVVIGSSAFLLLSPIYLSSINETTLPIAILSFLEVGSIYLPIQGIKIILKTRNAITLTKKEIEEEQTTTELDDIMNAYQLVKISTIKLKRKTQRKELKN